MSVPAPNPAPDEGGLDETQRRSRLGGRKAPPFRQLFELQPYDPNEAGEPCVPVETALEGDTCVFAARLPHQANHPVLDIDGLSEVPSVNSIVATTIVRARRPLPQITKLVLSHATMPPDVETFRCLPNLKTLWTRDWLAGFDTIGIANGLEHLGISLSMLPGGAASLSRFKQLRTLIVRNGEGDSMKHLAGLTRLEVLHVEGVGVGWHTMGKCTELRDVRMKFPKLTNLHPFKNWKKLERLYLHGKGVRSLDGLEAFEQLDSLTLRYLKLESLAPIGQLANLRTLWIDDDACSAEALATLPSILRKLPNLTELRCETIAKSGYQQLMAAHPSIQIKFYKTVDDDAAAAAARDTVTVVSPSAADGTTDWSIFADLAGQLNLENNYSAERLLKRELKAREPALLKRLDWDSESGNICVSGKTEAEIRIVEDVANELIRRKNKR